MTVSSSKLKAIANRMAALGIREEDLKEHFVRASGRGGQNVNKTSTCVVLHHVPTGIQVKCQIDRSQALNRFLARRILVEKLEARIKGAESAKQQAIEKIRRQKRRRSRRAKAKMLADKHHQAEKKRGRKLISPNAE